MTGGGTERTAARRARIVAAAREALLRLGPRGASMEAIARAAGVAKPTLYGYFPDKAAVREAVTTALAAEIGGAVAAALERDGPAAARVAAALAAMHRAALRLLGGSPHAAELWGGHDRAALEAETERRVAAVLAAAGAARPVQTARLVAAAADGIARRAASAAEAGPAIRLVVERVLAPELGNQG